jgi:nitronate monooxygenase/enoyl-[acyl-carrier protein] reductase II
VRRFQPFARPRSIGLFRSTAAVKRDIDVVRRLTSRPFAINHIPQTLDAEAFRYTLEARPAVISFALADPGDLVRQAHNVGSLVMLQVTTVAQAVQAAERGVDVIIAQGGEAGGYCGEISTMALVPQVVDAVSPVPVVAAGGIFDGRGIAAALMLGAVGVNLGTRFIPSTEAPAPEEWKQAITAAKSEDAIKVDVINDISLCRVPRVSTRSHALSRQLSWTSGAASVRRRVAIAIACGVRSFRRPRRAVHTSVCCGRARPPEGSMKSCR